MNIDDGINLSVRLFDGDETVALITDRAAGLTTHTEAVLSNSTSSNDLEDVK